ncbi:hypothetical protein SAMN04489761_4105 [Tenacibaculum sp. MAR_2009_124]|uniref:clostripain-related cysteine peptidase n=1 Tax=Tenacibaculum sp. MAR_2009_124 TaxID=1250059 RepID=UPI0008974FD4|nr:clostripain-related cysteine peptidase [Tenacibaculum sp. MAR_2009_124]SED05039.1 hypothetical protein SAMN04489761_4105 [Tenacibaculum sp. MAR_2009_124]
MTNVFLFIAGDNNLDMESEEELKGILSLEVESSYRVFIEIDRYKTYVSHEKMKRKSKRYVVDSNGVKKFFVEEKNTGDYRTLRSFIKWGNSRCPEESNYLILWGHGYGWEGCAHDYSQNDLLELDELKKALEIRSNKGFELVGFDMCQMATIEVSYAVRNFTDFMIASQNIEPPEGWDYNSLFKQHDSPLNFSKQILDGYLDQCRLKKIKDFTLSIAHLKNINKFMDLFNNWCLMVLTNEMLRNYFIKLRAELIDFKYHNYVDLKYFIQKMSNKENDSFRIASMDLVSFLDGVLLKTISGNVYKHATGLSIYFPLDEIPQTTFVKYGKTEFGKDAENWVGLLNEYQKQFKLKRL